MVMGRVKSRVESPGHTGSRSRPQDADADPALSDWDKYAAEEYDFLVAEEAADTWDGG